MRKYKSKIRTNEILTDPQLMLDESIALCRTMDWKIVDSMIVGLNSIFAGELFGSGKMEEIQGI